jgi:hypothetical protein
MNCCFSTRRRPPSETFHIGNVKISVQGNFSVRYSAVKYLEYLDTYYATTKKTGPFEWTVFFDSNVSVKHVVAETQQSAIRLAKQCINTVVDRETKTMYKE